ncbi:hypothetical protein BGX30_003807, partial [Mortierella sp. GBA39]
MIESFQQVVKSASPERLEAELITEYEKIMENHRNEILLQMQSQTIQEEAIQEAMRNGFREVRQIVLQAFREAGIPHPEERTMLFLARGMLCNVADAIIGATGGTGAAITEELVKRGIPTIAFGRSRQKLEQLAGRLGNPVHLKLAVGDAMRPEEIIAQAGDADVMFHCANVPYHEMASKLIPLGES